MSLRRTPNLIAALLLVAAMVTPAMAAQLRERDALSPEDIARADTFRAEFFQLLDVLQDIATLVNDPARHQRLEEARRLMGQVSSEDLATVSSQSMPPLQPLIRANVRLRSLLARRVEAPANVILNSSGFPGRPAILAACNNIAHDSAFTFGALIAVQVADALLAAVGRVCDQLVVAAGFGGNTALVCLPLEIALVAAKVPFELADFCGGEEDSSFLEGSFDRLEHIHGDVESSVANDNSNRDQIINNDNSNLTSIINNANTNTSTIISNNNANTATIITNANTNTTNIVNNDNTNRELIINSANANTTQLIAELRALSCEIVRLVNTPQGRRASSLLACSAQPGFPYDFPEPPLAPARP